MSFRLWSGKITFRFSFKWSYDIINYCVKVYGIRITYEGECYMTENKKKEMNKAQAAKRKRVNTLKSLIVFAAVILLLTSVVLNFVMVIKVLHLNNQIDKLYSIERVVEVPNTTNL